MPYLRQLAEVARRTGHPVTEVSGWKTRGHGPQPRVEGIVCHHTAGATAGGDYPSLAVVRDGRPGLDGPLSHFGIGRSGRIYVIAAGLCWHNAPSTSSQHTNSASIGIEAENNGRQVWPDAQLDAYRKLCAELCREFGLDASRVRGHKEVNTAKPDPHSVSMTAFRAAVARILEGDEDVAITEDDVRRIAEAVWRADGIIEAPPNKVAEGNSHWAAKSYAYWGYQQGTQILGLVSQLVAQTPDVDEDAVAAAVLAGLTPERIAAAIPDTLAEQVVTALGNRLTPQEQS